MHRFWIWRLRQHMPGVCSSRELVNKLEVHKFCFSTQPHRIGLTLTSTCPADAFSGCVWTETHSAVGLTGYRDTAINEFLVHVLNYHFLRIAPPPSGWIYQIVAVPFSVWLVHVCHCGNDNESKVQSVKMSSGRSVSHSRLRNASSMFFKLAILSLALGAVSLSPPPSPPGLLAAQRSAVPVNEWGKCESHRLRKTDTGGGLWEE